MKYPHDGRIHVGVFSRGSMVDYRITVLPGDGTGREVMTEAARILDAISESTNLGFEQTIIQCGGQHYLETGQVWAEGSYALCRDESDAILLGAIGWPGAKLENGDMAGGEVILGLRSGLDLYANVRPIKLYEGVKHKIHGNFSQQWAPDKVDLVVLRENTEGLYHSLLHRSAASAQGLAEYEPPELEFPGLHGEVAWDPRPISKFGSHRLIEAGFRLAGRRNGNPEGETVVHCVDKSNVTRGCQLFRKTFDEVALTHPEIKAEHAYIDAFTMWLVRNPEWFDVVVTTNMFGDIATDLGSVLQGGMGMAASANVGDEHGMFEPVHGSAPKYAGQNKVNPIASILSVQQMLGWLGRRKNDEALNNASRVVDQAVAEHLCEGKQVTYDLGGSATTEAVGVAIAARVKAILSEQ
jgi:3-isopropylmalate dehydrogenase